MRVLALGLLSVVVILTVLKILRLLSKAEDTNAELIIVMRERKYRDIKRQKELDSMNIKTIEEKESDINDKQ